jgi:inosine/xanthosine triphosphate pyrophosphatase family protein
MKEVIIATNNAGKGKDFEALFTPLGIKVLTLNDIEQKIDVEETGKTFEENAILKAEEVSFYVPSKKRAMAELSPEEKGLISHRGDALAKLRVKLPQLIQKVGL